ncbi:MAG TPA: winged helix-turn-helix domain-containing protein, partial [Tahibacter sp.]|nr:winged helix-turn-helix domain-containing protein [Tahibacter sp.]
MTPRAYRFEDLEIDLDRREVRRGDTSLELAGLSFDLFAYLLAQGPRVVGFDELIAEVWSPAVVGEETVTQRVKLLRQSLGDDGRRPRYVRS